MNQSLILKTLKPESSVRLRKKQCCPGSESNRLSSLMNRRRRTVQIVCERSCQTTASLSGRRHRDQEQNNNSPQPHRRRQRHQDTRHSHQQQQQSSIDSSTASSSGSHSDRSNGITSTPPWRPKQQQCISKTKKRGNRAEASRDSVAAAPPFPRERCASDAKELIRRERQRKVFMLLADNEVQSQERRARRHLIELSSPPIMSPDHHQPSAAGRRGGGGARQRRASGERHTRELIDIQMDVSRKLREAERQRAQDDDDHADAVLRQQQQQMQDEYAAELERARAREQAVERRQMNIARRQAELEEQYRREAEANLEQKSRRLAALSARLESVRDKRSDHSPPVPADSGRNRQQWDEYPARKSDRAIAEEKELNEMATPSSDVDTYASQEQIAAANQESTGPPGDRVVDSPAASTTTSVVEDVQSRLAGLAVESGQLMTGT